MREKEKDKALQIIDAVSNDLQIDVKDITGGLRVREYVEARFFAMYFIQKYTGLSLEKTGLLFDRDHSSVHHAKKTIDDLKDQKKYRVIYSRLDVKIMDLLYPLVLQRENRKKRTDFHYKAMFKRSRYIRHVWSVADAII